MTNRNPGLSKNTELVLNWAALAQEGDDTVREFWKSLCDLFDVRPTVTGQGILELLRTAGSHDVADISRDEPVPYSEVCRHIAEKFRPLPEDAECPKEDILSCERYILKRMEISEDDLETLSSAMGHGGKDPKKAAERAMGEASKKVASEVENQAAKLVRAGILIAVDIALAERTLYDLAGPADRKTIPGVAYVALLRKLHAAASAFRTSGANKPSERTRKHLVREITPAA
jgi:hypothetical protein